MKKSLRFICLILATVFLISGAAMIICHAEPEQGAGGGENTGGGGENTGGGAEISGGGAEISGGSGYESGGSGYESGGSGYGSGGYDSGYGSGGYDSGYGSGGYDSGNYNSGYDSGSYSGNSGQVEDPEPIYYGNASSHYGNNVNVDSTESAAGSVSSSLYDSSGMSDAEAAPNEWSDITLDEKTVKTGVTDFSAIKENSEVEDNGYWILYVGFALIGLAVLGILYFIIATIAHRSAVRKAERIAQRRRSSSPSHSAAARMEERERREAGVSRRTSRFADDDEGYYRSRRSSSRSDTDEVYVPRRAAKR